MDPAADLAHVSRYERGSNSARIPGEGIGLASVRMLVELHGGHVDVDSVEGQGTTFTVRLPLGSVAAAPERDPAVFA
jgi:signal transduction histidine kinase